MPLKGLTPGISLASFPSPIPPKSGGSSIKSIQRGVSTFATNANTMSIPISPIDPAKSVVKVTSVNVSGTSGVNSILTRADIQDATTLVMTRDNNVANGVDVAWEVIEFNNVKSKQTGNYSLTVAGTEQIVPISSVNTSKSLILFSFSSTINGQKSPFITGRIVSNTSIGFKIETDVGQTISWQVIEFN